MSKITDEAIKTAHATLINEIAAPYFFEKLAANGIRPANQEEAEALWAMGEKLHVMFTAANEKTASAQTSALLAENERLDGILAKTAGYQPPKTQMSSFHKAAAVQAAQPNIANAVLTLQAAIAEAANANQETE